MQSAFFVQKEYFYIIHVKDNFFRVKVFPEKCTISVTTAEQVKNITNNNKKNKEYAFYTYVNLEQLVFEAQWSCTENWLFDLFLSGMDDCNKEL